MPAHARAPRHHPSRWALLVAVAAVATLVAVVRPAMGHGDQPAAAPLETATETAVPTTPAPRTTTAPTVTPTPRPTPKPKPTVAVIPVSASGRLVAVPGEVPAAGAGTPLRYRIEVEAGLPLDAAAVAAQVHRILTDPRGWQRIEGVAFARTAGAADFQLLVASPDLVDRLCYPLDTNGELSCRNGDRVILNARRWATAVPWYGRDLDAYRAYLVNHEVGHRLGHGHKGCPAAGAPAPVMVQQSKSLYGCAPNPWPAVAY